MPKAQSTDARVNEFKRMTGTDFAMRTASDMLLLQPTERERALRMLGALHDTVTKESQAIPATRQ